MEEGLPVITSLRSDSVNDTAQYDDACVLYHEMCILPKMHQNATTSIVQNRQTE